MPTIDLQGTKFGFFVLSSMLQGRDWATTKIVIENEYISYEDRGKYILRDELEEWIFAMSRLLAGAYNKEYSISFQKAGIAVDLYPYTDGMREIPREERRKNDCVMAIRLLMRSTDKKNFLGGVYSVVLHRAEIESFVAELRKEFDKAFARYGRGKGKYLFVGVSPRGYRGCNYWYLDPTGTTLPGDFVWVRMGRHNTEQIVYVDSVKFCDEGTSPYPPDRVKQVLRKATEEEIENIEI